MFFLQVDGLGHEVARRAVRDGNMPTFAAWLAAGSHRLTYWNTDWSSQTGAAVCGILHGDNAGILGYRFYEKDRDHVVVCGNPEDAAYLERTHSDGRGLLAVDGAGHGNLFTGDAPHVSLTMSALPLLSGAQRRRGRARDGLAAGYVAYFANPANALRTGVGYLVDVVREISAATRQRRAGVVPRMDRGGFYPFAPGRDHGDRPGHRGLRGARGHAGRPVVRLRRPAGLRRGRAPLRHRAVRHAGRAALDRPADRPAVPGHPARAAPLPRGLPVRPRPDPGAAVRAAVRGDHRGADRPALRGVARAVPADPAVHDEQQRLATRRSAEGWQVGAVLHEASGGPIARRLRARVQPGRRRADPAHPVTESGAVDRVAPGVVVVLSGHTAMVSFTRHTGRVELETIEREFPDLLPALVDHDGVGFLLVRSAELGPIVFGRDGELRLSDGTITGQDPLAGYGPHAADLIRRFDGFPNCPDIVINSRYDPATDDATPFEPHVGTHGGLGGPQSRGFLMYPAQLPAPPREIVGAEHLHRVLRGWLTHLGHPEPEPAPGRDAAADPSARTGCRRAVSAVPPAWQPDRRP